MATDEPEITSPVSLCLPDGVRLNPQARGWSRVPLHEANLRGRRLRTKKWDYWAILTDDIAVALTYADIGYLGLADVWWVDRARGVEGGHQAPIPAARGIELPDRPGTAPLWHRGRSSSMDIVDDETGTTLTASWTEDGQPARFTARVDLPPGQESCNVVIPWDERIFQYTSKHQARPARGSLIVGDREWSFGGEHGQAWGVLDVGRGRWPYSTRWNWGSGCGVADGSVVGLQFGGKWTEGTGFTENAVIVDGRATKIGAELRWEYDWSDPMRPWRVTHPDGSLDVTLVPDYDRHSAIKAVVLATEVHQVFGRWSGHLTADDGRRIVIDQILGFAEESRSRW
ncbi:DUF2804 domain-containing protein [Gordonia crocea]|uniref:DUF2804 domain-containing protein n=1 Tax=Gordonia crocea TaxID=589162 RepID=A0A7M3SUF5_9ACTN|nr:DUF2804 domain-containing protein [Gordonia crocea]GED96279.1 hypothetical protein nbrc107697_03180 [Gordonia crocea]